MLPVPKAWEYLSNWSFSNILVFRVTKSLHTGNILFKKLKRGLQSALTMFSEWKNMFLMWRHHNNYLHCWHGPYVPLCEQGKWHLTYNSRPLLPNIVLLKDDIFTFNPEAYFHLIICPGWITIWFNLLPNWWSRSVEEFPLGCHTYSILPQLRQHWNTTDRNLKWSKSTFIQEVFIAVINFTHTKVIARICEILLHIEMVHT